MCDKIISISGLSHCYRTFSRDGGLFSAFKDFILRNHVASWALRDFDLTVYRGEIIGILGPNGSGKTTLIKVLSGLVYPTTGRVTVCGDAPCKKRRQFLQQIGVVLGQRSQLQWDLPAIDTLRLLGHIYRIPRNEYQARLGRFLEMLNLASLECVPVRSLSLGERMKFELIAALIHKPSLLFLDEPTIGLDIISQRTVRAFLREINEIERTTVLMTSHYMRDLELVSNRIAVIADGRLSFLGSSAELIAQFPFNHRVIFTTDAHPDLPEWEVQEQRPGEFSVHCRPDQLGKLLHDVTENCQVDSIRTELPSLEDAALKLMSLSE